jgi:hypothetical protein
MAPREAQGATAAPLGAERERETAGGAVSGCVEIMVDKK